MTNEDWKNEAIGFLSGEIISREQARGWYDPGLTREEGEAINRINGQIEMLKNIREQIALLEQELADMQKATVNDALRIEEEK